MADNAPNAVQIGPYPNIVCLLAKRIELHLATILVTATVPSIVQARSTRGISVVDGGAGVYTLAFPGGGTGAIGWSVVSVAENTAPSGATCFVVGAADNDTTNYATGVLELHAKDAAGADADPLTLTTFTVMIYVVKP